MKTPNHLRAAKNAVARAAALIPSMVARQLETERYAEEHKDDCHCTFCDCFGQGACAGVANMTPEEYEAYWMST